MKKIILTSDHGGFELKDEFVKYFKDKGYELEVLGAKSNTDSCSYAEKGIELAKEVLAQDALGIGICGTGLGISFAVNRFKGIRGARLTSVEDAEMAKIHNNANVLLFGGRQLSSKEAIKIFEKFISEKYEGGRHQARIDQLDNF